MDFDFEGTDRFEIISRLGEGAMGVVYRGLDREKNETIAIKTLRELTGDGLLRFKNEFRSVQSLQHSNLISLGELIEARGRWFFTMELVDGSDFYSWVRARNPKDHVQGPPSSDYSSTSATAHTQPAWMSAMGPAPGFDEARLRAALVQLAQGVAALHHAGFVHRDIKPSNVLVSREGRVVLLDFGFVTSARDRSSDRIVGTAAYMSPEQAASMTVSPESDWYSVGVMLYEALTGRPPIEGTPMEVLMGKQHRVPVPPSQLVAGVPIDLEELSMELLSIRPEERPREREILARLGASPTAASASLSIDLSRSLFVGRDSELGELQRCFDRYRSGVSMSVFVHGESGIGKSALVREFTRQLESSERGTLVLSSQCYERESVPYKAFDGVVDALSRHMGELSDVDAAILVPLHVTPVAQVFPVMRRSEVIARAIRPVAASLEPAELRGRMFAGLRDMFARLANRQPVVVVIDDFQWADADSLALLKELFRQPEAPSLMLIATVRGGSERRAPGGPHVELATDQSLHMHLRGLDAADARALAGKIAQHVAPGMPGVVDAVLGDSHGHPLYIDEMLRHSALAKSAPTASLQLETVLWHRILGLEAHAREVLELIALSTIPLDAGVAAAAARMSFADFSRWASLLRVGKLIQTTGARRADLVTVFHDRVRQTVLQNLDGVTRRRYHERLALALESGGSPAAEAVAVHWSGAGDRERAYEYTKLAAAQAEQALAFERAARLYRKCLDLLEPGSRAISEVHALAGNALANAGLGAEAANAYLSAAEVSPDHSVELYGRAAGQLLRSGHVDSGLEILRRALAPLGLHLPGRPMSAMVALLAERAALWTRGLRFRERSESELSRREITRVDVSWALAAAFALIDVVRGAAISARHVRISLATGEPSRIARALSLEVAFRYTGGSRSGEDARRVLARAEMLTARVGNPSNLQGQNKLMAGIGGICEGRWEDAEDACSRAAVILRERGSGVAWELSSARLMHLWSLWYLGRLDEIAERLPNLLREAQDRGDLYAATSFLTYFTPMDLLAADDAHGAAEAAHHALDRWSQQGFHFQHYFRLFATIQVHLYAGDHALALETCRAQWKALKASMLLTVQQQAVEATHFLARAELAHGRATGDPTLLAQVLKRAKTILGQKSIWGDGLARLLEAGVAYTRGDTALAIARLEAAIERLESRKMSLFVHAARRTLGVVRDGAEGAAQIARADAAMQATGIVNPQRMAAMLVPGFEPISARALPDRSAAFATVAEPDTDVAGALDPPTDRN